MRIVLYFFVVFFMTSACTPTQKPLKRGAHDLHYDNLASRWDEAIPLGNGMMGALVWQHDGQLRLSLDRADLWDLRPMDNLDTPEWKYKWVYEQWKKGEYGPVQEKFDVPYDRNPAPSKIPAAALEFDINELGPVESVHLYLQNAVCEVKWKSGARLITFVHATQPVGWYRFEGVNSDVNTCLINPDYNLEGDSRSDSPVTGQDLRRLGYPRGTIHKDGNSITYDQKGWAGFEYQVNVRWEKSDDIVEGCWSISTKQSKEEKQIEAQLKTAKVLKSGFGYSMPSHNKWWNDFWAQSSVSLPDTILEKQWFLEQYKFGSAARKGAPPISLQAVWTADNGKLPPWKGDFHHDLNTQLSYWPAYSGNHLEQEEGFLDWLWKYKPVFNKYTREYFETSGLNVPGVTTLTGQPMGGWIQYSFSPTVGAWLGHHFYKHWRYSMDSTFLKERAYPWIKEVAIHLDELSLINKNGKRTLPISSSPEMNNNSHAAWFGQTTNYDLALIRFTYSKAHELAMELGLKKEAEKWNDILSQWPDFAVDKNQGLKVSPTLSYNQSHRHFSHLMAIHPLGLIDWSQGHNSQEVIKNSMANLEKYGSDWWVGYSFSWQGNIYARMGDGEKAAQTLKIFANSFCLPNSFHANGDQSGEGFSKFTYRPFTLEGNFAFAAGIQEMLLQSHSGVVRIFPAIPQKWQQVAFKQLRTEGAFLISASRVEGEVDKVVVNSQKGGKISILNPFHNKFTTYGGNTLVMDGIINIDMDAGQVVTLKVKSIVQD